MTSVIDCRTHPKDLLAQKLSSPSRAVASVAYDANLGDNAREVKHGYWNFGRHCAGGHLGDRRVDVRRPRVVAFVAHRRRLRHHLADCRSRRPAASEAKIPISM